MSWGISGARGEGTGVGGLTLPGKSGHTGSYQCGLPGPEWAGGGAHGFPLPSGLTLPTIGVSGLPASTPVPEYSPPDKATVRQAMAATRGHMIAPGWGWAGWAGPGPRG